MCVAVAGVGGGLEAERPPACRPGRFLFLWPAGAVLSSRGWGWLTIGPAAALISDHGCWLTDRLVLGILSLSPWR